MVGVLLDSEKYIVGEKIIIGKIDKTLLQIFLNLMI
jgi:hypothetical protein